MKARCLSVIIFIIIMFSAFGLGLAQENVSAEFISAYKPPKSMLGVQARDGIKQVQIKNNTLFVVDEYTGLQILDVSNVHKPKEIASVPTTHLTQNIFLAGHLAFLSGRLDGVYVLDISDPAHPKILSHLKPVAESYWVVSKDSLLYVAEADSGIAIYDVVQPEHPRLVSVTHLNGFTWGLGVKDNYLFALDKRKGLLVFDITDPVHLKKVGDLKQIIYARSILFDGPYMYVANGPAGLWILDVSDLHHPKIVNRIPMHGYAYSATRSGNTIFVGNSDNRTLEFFDAKDPARPTKEGVYKSESHIYNAIKKDIYVYVAADSNTLILRYNRPPQLAAISDKETDENKTLSFQVSAYEPDSDPIWFSIKPLPQGAKFDSLKGIFVWTPTYDQSGVYPITITVHERTQSHLTDSKSFKITVHHVNRPPTIADIPDYEVNENQMLTFTIPEGQDPDKEDAGKLTYSAASLPPGATFNPETRVFKWKPTYDQAGIYTVDFAVHDPAGLSAMDASTITVHNVDRPPVLASVPPQTVDEGQLLTFKLNGHDPDKEDQNKLHYAAYHLPEGATFNPQTATFTWKPTYDQSGNYKNILFVLTSGPLSDSVTVDITVKHVNRPPVISPLKNFTVDENKLLRFKISAHDPDKEDKGKLKYRAENLPEGARFFPDSLVFRWKPTFEQSGVYDNVLFIVQDPAGLSDTARTTITVNHVNRPPVLAAIPAQTVDENQPLTIVLKGSDPDKEDQGKLTYSGNPLPEGAQLQGNTFTWTPNYDQSGKYKITFTVSDGRLSNSKTVAITVNHVNRPPVLAAIAPKIVDENQLLTFKVTGSDPDKEDAGKLKLSAGNLPQGATFNAQSGQFSWKPNFDQSGSYSVTFVITDPAGLSDSASVPITVNHVNRTPVFPAQKDQTVNENTLLTYKLIPATDPDKEDKGKLKYSVSHLPAGANFNAQTLTLTWKPTYEQSGVYTLEFQVTDGEFSVKQPLKITVVNVNRPPVIEPIPAQTVDENKLWTLQVKASDPDKEDAGKLRFTASNLPQGMQFDSLKAVFNWKPTYDQAGNYAGISVTVKDQGGLSDQKTFAITVNNVNRPPVLEAIAPVKGIENTPISIRLKGSDPDKEDAGKLVYGCHNLPKGATLNAQTGLFKWTPDFLQAGTYDIVFKVTDSGQLSAEQTAHVIVEDLNRPPTLQTIPAKTVKEDGQLTFTVTGKDPDTDNTLTYSAKGLPQGAQFDAQTQTFSWKPDFNQAGSYKVTFTVSDGKTSAAITVPIKVINVNRAPQFVSLDDQTINENETLKFTVKATDPDAGSTLTLSCPKLPDGARFDSETGVFTWQPNFEQAGSYPVTFTVSDGDTSISRTITITVNNVNRPPKFETLPAQQVKEKEQLKFTVKATDPDAGSQITYRAKQLPEGAKFDAQNATFSWTPGYDQAGNYTVIFVADDGEAETTLPVQITVVNVNRSPVLNAPKEQTVEAGHSVQLAFKGNDPDGDKLTYSAKKLPRGATLDSNTGMVNWTPANDQSGTFTITVTVSDGHESATASTKVNVKPKPQPAPADTSGN